MHTLHSTDEAADWEQVVAARDKEQVRVGKELAKIKAKLQKLKRGIVDAPYLQADVQVIISTMNLLSWIDAYVPANKPWQGKQTF